MSSKYFVRQQQDLEQPVLRSERLHDSDVADQGTHSDSETSKMSKPELFESSVRFAYDDLHSPPNPVEPPQSPSVVEQWKPHQNRVLRFWRWEMLSLFVSIGLMAAIIAILMHFNGQKLPEWPFSINLNTLIAILSAIFRATMLMVVAEILGQARWSWFTQMPRPLFDLQEFDQASRSVFGSLRLVGVVIRRARIEAGAIALSAALIIIMSFGIGPFTQQAIKTRPCTQVLQQVNSTLPVAQYVPSERAYYRVASGVWELSVDMKGTMINGITNPRGNDTAVIASCPTGNCSFPDYGTGVTHASIGMCSKCIDTTRFLSPPNDAGNVSLPDGTSVNFESDKSWLMLRDTNLSYAESIFPADFAEAVPAAFLNRSIVAVSKSPCTNSSGVLTCPHDWSNVTYGVTADVVATSCTMYPCLRSYFGSVRDGVLDERVVSTRPAPVNKIVVNATASIYTHDFTALRSPCVLEGRWYTENNMSTVPHVEGRYFTNIIIDGKNITAPKECLYKMSEAYSKTVQGFMSSLLYGQCDYNSRQGDELWCYDKWWLSPLYNNMNASFISISQQIDDFTIAITNKFRSTGLGPYASREVDPNGVVAVGEVFETTVCTYLDWQWLLLPGLLVVASTLLLAWTVMRNYTEPEQPVWKGSVLPLLFYGLRGSDANTSGSQFRALQHEIMELDEIEGRARKMVVRYRTAFEPGFVVGSPGESKPFRNGKDIDMDSLLGER